MLVDSKPYLNRKQFYFQAFFKHKNVKQKIQLQTMTDLRRIIEIRETSRVMYSTNVKNLVGLS